MENTNEFIYIVNGLGFTLIISGSILLFDGLIYAIKIGWVKFWICRRKRHADKLAELMKHEND